MCDKRVSKILKLFSLTVHREGKRLLGTLKPRDTSEPELIRLDCTRDARSLLQELMFATGLNLMSYFGSFRKKLFMMIGINMKRKRIG